MSHFAETFSQRLTSNPGSLFAYGGIFAAVMLFITVLELGIIYHASLSTSIYVCDVLGLQLTPPDPDRAFVIAALARAALELGNPTSMAFNIDPLKEMPKWILYLSGFLYMAKTGLLSFCFKMLIKRALLRASAKGLLAFAAMPIVWYVWCIL